MAEKTKKTKEPAKAKSGEPKDTETIKVAKKTTAAAAKPQATAAKAVEVTEKAPSAGATGLRAVPAKTRPISEVKAIRETKAVNEEMAIPKPSREQIAQLAHRFWRERGGDHGEHEQDWFRAERELRGMAS